MKCSSETLQNLPYFWNTKTHSFFRFSFRATLFFPQMNALVNVDRLGHSLGGKLNSTKCKMKKKLGFCTPKIWQILKHFTKHRVRYYIFWIKYFFLHFISIVVLVLFKISNSDICIFFQRSIKSGSERTYQKCGWSKEDQQTILKDEILIF